VNKFLLVLELIFLAFITLAFPSPAKAVLIFSDSFQGGYSSSWYVPTGSAAPVPSPFGISGENSNNWSVINHSLINNENYHIRFDLKINKDNTTQAWGMGISNDAGAWKLAGNWNQQLQIHDSTGSEKIVQWDHSQGIHHFDVIVSSLGNTPFIVKEDENLLYSLITNANFDIKSVTMSFQGNGDYEMANFSLSTYEEPTPTPTTEPTLTPTPEPTPTPTSIPTPTNTPTPTPSQPKKVIFLHGMGGSWNAEALLNCKSSGYTGTWSPWIIQNFDIYSSVIEALKDNNYEVIPYYYDWRKTTAETAIHLTQFIKNHTAPNESFNLIGHSFGGLVGRAYLGSTREDSHIDKFLTIGSPHKGSVLAYPMWSGGEIWINDTAMRLGLILIQASCAAKKSWIPRVTVQTLLPSIQNLLPIFDYLTNSSGQTKPIVTMTAKNNWLPDTFTPPYYGVNIKTITGTGYATLRTIQVSQLTRLDKQFGNWKDGKPTNIRTYADGDGTVLTESSQLPDVLNISLPLDHAGLVTHPSGVSAILDFLNDSPSMLKPLKSVQNPQQYITPSKGAAVLLIAAEGSHFTLTDIDGNSVRDSEGQITILDPSEDTYTLTIIPTKKLWWHKTKIMVIQLFEDGTSTWKEYTYTGGSHRFWKLNFDRLHKHNDILRDK